ncbi:MAG: radical SAM protein [Candidatus Helarchaeota archaeon]|nr:radical SAM protein [Candidatus Helarchaeota archaeon]
MINPWIYDFSAYDLWMKPLGLLYIGAVLEENGFEVYLVDCLDRYHPEILKGTGKEFPKGEKKYGCGNFYKEEIDKPEILKNVNRKYSRYGLPPDIFIKEIKNVPEPDVILVTSMMTYWYPALYDIIKIVRDIYKNIPIIVGGIYVALALEHAEKYLNVDKIVKGEGENQVLPVIFEILGKFNNNYKYYNSIDDFPFPSFHLLKNIRYLPVLTSRGCPFRCTFCASRVVSGEFRKRSPESVVDEIRFHRKKFNVLDFAFYDDALLVNREKHIIPILEGLLKNKIKIRFHTPNGLFPSMIDDEFADLMYRSGFKTVRLSLETIHPERLKDINFKVTVDDFEQCIESLVRAGYKRKELESYVLYGLTGQSVREVVETMVFASKNGIKVRLAAFSPIPGTIEWKRAVVSGELSSDADLLITNKTVLPLRSKNFSWDVVNELKKFANIINYASDIGINMFRGSSISEILKKIFSTNSSKFAKDMQ